MWKATTAEPTDGLTLLISPLRVLHALAFAALLMAAAHAIGLLLFEVYEYPSLMRRLIDLSEEGSLGTWVSGALLLFIGVVLSLIAIYHRAIAGLHVFHWAFLSLIFFGLSADETLAIHEETIRPLRRWLDAGGVIFFPWVIPYLILAGVVFVAYVRFLLHLPKSIALLFLASGGIYVGGAAGLEMVEGVIVEHTGFVETVQLAAAELLEETIEVLGLSLFIFALLLYARDELGVDRLVFPRSDRFQRLGAVQASAAPSEEVRPFAPSLAGENSRESGPVQAWHVLPPDEVASADSSSVR